MNSSKPIPSNDSAASSRTNPSDRFSCLLGLWLMAVVHPVLSMLASNATFFSAHQSQAADVITLTLLICFMIPIIVFFVYKLIQSKYPIIGRWIYRCVMAGLSICFVCYWINFCCNQFEWLGRIFHHELMYFLAGLLCSAGLLVGLLSYEQIRYFFSICSFAILLVPLWFLFLTPVSSIISPQQSFDRDSVQIGNPTPVVMIVFDEFPLHSLLNQSRDIDEKLFPNFAKLAERSVWYRNATSNHPSTDHAVPSLLSGRIPPKDSLPISADHPGNLMEILKPHYAMNVHEEITNFAPMIDRQHDYWTRMIDLSKDIRFIIPHLYLPDSLVGGREQLETRWNGFANESETKIGNSKIVHSSRTEIFDHWLDKIVSTDKNEKPQFHFLHILLPHSPFNYLPDGTMYAGGSYTRYLENGIWQDEEFALDQYQAHLLQVQYVDRLIGQLMDELDQSDIWDRSTIVITADHGICFQMGNPPRELTKNTANEILPIPLFVKYPEVHDENSQSRTSLARMNGTTDDRNAESIDVYPTMLEVLDISINESIAAQFDPPTGVSLLDSTSQKNSTVKTAQSNTGELLTFTADRFDSSNAISRKFRYFDQNLMRRSPIERIQSGESVDINRLTPGKESDRFHITLDSQNLYRKVDPKSGFIPACISGSVLANVPDGESILLAVAMHNKIAGVTPTSRFSNGKAKWSLMVPIHAFQSGDNTPRVYRIVEEKKDQFVFIAEDYSSNRLPYPNLECDQDGFPIQLTADTAKNRTTNLFDEHIEGWLDSVEQEDSILTFYGWAMDKESNQPVDWIAAYADGKLVGYATPEIERMDLKHSFGTSDNLRCGFACTISREIIKNAKQVVFITITKDRARCLKANWGIQDWLKSFSPNNAIVFDRKAYKKAKSQFRLNSSTSLAN